MGKKNVVLADNSREEMEDYRRGLEDAAESGWEVLVCRANQGRKGKLGELLRYGKYFLFSFRIFLQRERFEHIVAWQSFYGICFAFWCRVFGVKKQNFLVVKNLTYREKKGAIGWLYFHFMRFAVKSPYVDVFTCCSREHCKFCGEIFEEPTERFQFAPFAVADVGENGEIAKGDYVLSLGRSNRDWGFLVEALGGGAVPVRIVCDTLKMTELPSNFQLYKNVWGENALEFLRNCRLVVLPILDSRVASGETVLLQAMSCGKPVVVVRDSGEWAEYIEPGENGFVVPKDGKRLREIVGMLWENEALYRKISRNSRECFLRKYSLFGYGCRIGRLIKERKRGEIGDGCGAGVPGGGVSGCVRGKSGGAELQESGNFADRRRFS